MMLKKLITLLSLITIATLSESMENGTSERSAYVLSEEELTVSVDILNNVLRSRNEQNIIAFLQTNHYATQERLAYIINKVFELNLKQVLEHLRRAYQVPNDLLIEAAIEAGDIPWIKEFTHFDDYVDGEMLNEMGYYHLNGYNRILLYEIIAYDGVNYFNSFGKRYLQRWIKKTDHANNLIIRFINKASLQELNTLDPLTRSTALLEATNAWQRCNAQNNHEGMNFFTFIIQRLLERGADPTIANNQHHTPQDSEFFQINSDLCVQWQNVYQQSLPINNNARTNDTQIKNKSNKINYKALTGIAVLGVTACYIAYKIFFSKTRSTQIVKLK